MSVIKYKILETKRMSTDRDYFTSAGENITTTLNAAFPDAYSTLNGWSQFVTFQLINSVQVDPGVAQVETATLVGTITTAGNVNVTVTAAGMTGSPKLIAVAVALSDTADLIAGKIRTALAADVDVSAKFAISGATTAVILTAKSNLANDTTLNVATADGTSIGVTASPTSANTTAGVAPLLTNAPKFSIPDGVYSIPNTLIAATILNIQFRAEKLINTVINVFESEKKIFPRTSTSIVGVSGAATTLPNVYVTQGTLAGTLSTYIVGGTGITATYSSVTGKTTITATGTALPGAHASSHAVGGLDPVSPASLGAASAATLDTHTSDIINHIQYVIAGGAANAYTVSLTPVPTAYTEGMAFAVKIPAATTGASTVMVGSLVAIAIKRGNGTDTSVNTLIAGGVYTLRYNGVNFILQGEGGGGTALVGDLLVGKTATVDAGAITGTMPNKVGSLTVLTPSGADIIIPQGYFGGAIGDGKVAAVVVPAANVLTGTTIAGTVGTMPNKVGSLTVITPSTVDQAIAQGYYGGVVGDGKALGDLNLIEANIKSGVSIFGKVGTVPVYTYLESGNVLYSNATLKTVTVTTVVEEVIANFSGSLSVGFTGYSSSGNTYYATATVAKNGIIFGANPIWLGVSASFSVSVTGVVPGDHITLTLARDQSLSVSVSAFSISATPSTTSTMITVVI